MTAGTVSWGELHDETRQRLARVDAAPAEARWIVERAAGDRLESVADAPATQRAVAHLDAMVERRQQGEPVQYVLGRWAFRELDLLVDRRVLIPRPETEVVAGVAVEALRASGGRRALDLGTGSGAIALSLAVECPGVQVWGTDASADALAVARANTAALGRRGRHVTLLGGEWYAALPSDLRGTFDVVVANPPYVTDDEPLPPEVERWEPVEALRAGPDGLDDVRIVLGGAGEWLAPGGTVVCELDPRQAETAAALAADAGLVDVEVVDDLAGRPRAVVGRRG